MTSKGAQLVIDSMSMRIFEIQEIRDRLDKEEIALQSRIIELEFERDQKPIQPQPIISVV
jgi:hypothetical protein